MGLKAHQPPFLIGSKLSWLRYIEGKLVKGLITFINARFLANWDFQYHDFETNTTAVAHKAYIVGENNILQGQRKLFVSKSTAIMCTEDCHIHLNESDNVVIEILADTWYEFLSNIHMIHFARAQGVDSGTIHIICEGVLPQEAGRPE